MAQGISRQIPGDLEDGLRAVEHWRETRSKQGAMPEELWGLAVGLARQHGIWLTARVLRLDYTNLKTRLGQTKEGRSEGRSSAGGRAAVPGFVELGVAQPGVTSHDDGLQRGAVVELFGADGAKLQIRLPEHEQVDVRELVEAFWRRGA